MKTDSLFLQPELESDDKMPRLVESKVGCDFHFFIFAFFPLPISARAAR